MSYDFDTVPDRRGSDSIKWAKYAGRKSDKGEDFIPMWVADMDFAAPPEVIAALQERVAHGVMGYGHTIKAFNDAIITALQRDYAWAVQAEWIVPLSGLVSGLNIAARAIGERGDALVTATPVYPHLYTAATNMERESIRVALDEKQNWSWDMAALAAVHTPNTKGLFLCHPHNPVGRVWSDTELSALAEHAEQHDLVVVSDEIHCELVLEPGLKHRPFATLSPQAAARSITLMAPSKTYNIPGLGAAFAIIPDTRLRQRFQQAMAGIVPHLNILGMAATIAAYEKGAAWRSALLDYLRGNRDLVMTLEGVHGLRVIKPEATYLAWLDCAGLGENPRRFFEHRGLGLLEGDDFGPADSGRFMRLNFGCSRTTLQQCLDRIRAS